MKKLIAIFNIEKILTQEQKARIRYKFEAHKMRKETK